MMTILVRYTEQNEAQARKAAETLLAGDHNLDVAVLPMAEQKPIKGLSEDVATKLVQTLSAQAEELGGNLTIVLNALEPDEGTGYGIRALVNEAGLEALKTGDAPEWHVIKEALFKGPLVIQTDFEGA